MARYALIHCNEIIGFFKTRREAEVKMGRMIDRGYYSINFVIQRVVVR